MRQGRTGGSTEDRPATIPVDDDDDRHNERHDDRHEARRDNRRDSGADDDGPLGQIEDWIIIADRRMERLDAKIDRLGAAIDQLNTQLGSLLTEMPTRKGINLYLVGGLVGGLAVGLAIMGITIGGFVGGLSSLRPEGVQATAAAPSYPAPPPAPIIIQMPANAFPNSAMTTPPPPPAPPPAVTGK